MKENERLARISFFFEVSFFPLFLAVSFPPPLYLVPCGRADRSPCSLHRGTPPLKQHGFDPRAAAHPGGREGEVGRRMRNQRRSDSPSERASEQTSGTRQREKARREGRREAN